MGQLNSYRPLQTWPSPPQPQDRNVKGQEQQQTSSQRREQHYCQQPVALLMAEMFQEKGISSERRRSFIFKTTA